MSQVVEGLRRTPKGQLTYNRNIDGKSLTDLFQKCASAPVLSSPHSEMSPSHQGHSASFGLAPEEEEEESSKADQSVLGDHQYGKNMDRTDSEEKGKQDSFEREHSLIGDHKRLPVLSSFGSPQRKSHSPNLKVKETKSPKSCHFIFKETSQMEQAVKRTEDQSFSLKESKDNGEEPIDSTHDELTVKFTEKLRAVCGVEMDWDNRLKDSVEKKQLEFLNHQAQLDTKQGQLISEIETRQMNDMEQLYDIIEKKHLSRKQEIDKVVQKVKDTHKECSRRQDARLKEVERLNQQLKEEKVKREQALEKRLNDLKSMARAIADIKTTLQSTVDNCPHKEHLSEVAEKTKLFVCKLSEQSEVFVNSLTRDGPLEETFIKLKQFQEQCQNALDHVNSLTAEAEKKARAAVEAQQQGQQATTSQQPQPGPAAAPPQSSQTPAAQQSAAAGEEMLLATLAKEFEGNVKLLTETDIRLAPFVGNQQMKKVRFDLQKAVNVPVNAISPVDRSHLWEKLQRLRSLLKGEMVPVQGKQVSARSVDEGIPFCKNLVAKMIARKADEQVSSSHESAFAIAAVAVGLWVEFPDVGKLLMAHLQALCPYVLPFYPPHLPNQSSEDYHRSLGYKVEEDGTVESQDKFLRRMSGLLRLYAAIMVTSPPQGVNHPHPHGLEHAWIWLSRACNLQINQDITATAIYDMLQVTGNHMLRAYSVQFVKLLYFLYKNFLPKLKDVAAGSGPVSRLETFLETAMKNNALIPVPEGYLPPHFWR